MPLTRRDVAGNSAITGAGVAPVGGAGVLSCAPQALAAVDAESGRAYPVARDELDIGTAREPEFGGFTGVTFPPDGRTLYAGIREPGLTLAVTGPGKRQRRR